MALSNYQELVASVRRYARNSALDVADMITLCEQRIRDGSGKEGEPYYSKPLRLQIMQGNDPIPVSLGASSAALPSGFLSFAETPYIMDDGGKRNLKPTSSQAVNDVRYGIQSDIIREYGIVGLEMQFPVASISDVDIRGKYYALPPLSLENPSNALLVQKPGVYLMGTLLEVDIYKGDDVAAQRHFAAYQAAAHGAIGADELLKTGNVPLAPRVDGMTP